MTKKLLYFEPHDPCCNDGRYKSQEELIKEKAIIGTAYLVDEITGEEWGDDWNDAPMCCNAGSPYREKCKGLEIREIRIGDTL